MDNMKKGISAVREKIQNSRQCIRQTLMDHVGQYAILIEKGGKQSFSFFIQITSPCTGKYQCYDYEGNFRCFVTKYLDIIQLFIGEQQLIYLDGI